MNSYNKFNVAYIKLSTKTEGPFNRCAIWFQGCNINCEGCCNFSLQPIVSKNIVNLNDLVKIVLEAKDKYDIEGVTLTGGEPTIQKNLDVFCKRLHEINMGIILFTGLDFEKIPNSIKENVDLILAGPYMRTCNDTKRLLLGSKNKTINNITKRYEKQLDYFYNEISYEEVCVSNYIFINGD